MIKSLSPYYLNIPFVDPSNGDTCTSFILKIFVWDGFKANRPDNFAYSITKKNPTASTGFDKINLSRLVNDFIDFTPNESNQRWCKVTVAYDTSFRTDQDLFTTLILKGYDYGMSGENPQPPVNRILMQGKEFNVQRSGVFNLPILILEA